MVTSYQEYCIISTPYVASYYQFNCASFLTLLHLDVFALMISWLGVMTQETKKQRIREIRVFFVSYKMYLAAGEGFEPSQTDPESVVLPLHNPAISATVVIIAHCPWVMQEFLRTILQHRAAVV